MNSADREPALSEGLGPLPKPQQLFGAGRIFGYTAEHMIGYAAAAVAAERERCADTIARMAAWLEGDCTCPCCEGVRECSPGCTFAVDCPTDAERMHGAREALFGP